jgi:hypothetical protein
MKATASSPRSRDGRAKITLRVRPEIAAMLATSAAASGLSHGDFVTSVLEGAPAPPMPHDHAECLEALGLSTDRLAVIGRDVSELVRLHSGGSVPAAVDFICTLGALETGVREHLRLASQLLGDLRAEAAHRPRPSRAITGAET